ncbi:MAG: prolipoprotein diacylglyceryl transferase [Lachnospiraceae bacterium]|nr:prolipoprotein diacylglyceryl transferase [Lachnospiraceae bacterium]
MSGGMGDTDIWFPHLQIYFENLPKSVTVFGIEIAFYGMIIALGMLGAVYLCAHLAERFGLTPDDIWNIAILVIVFGVLGARIYYVAFSWDAYRDNPAEIFNIRGGGLAIYGGVIAGFLTVYVYAKRNVRQFLRLTDVIMHGLLFGQILGRWGNFTNREAFGEYTDNLFAMRLPVQAVRSQDITETMRAHMPAGANYIQVHPTFLYESTWNLCLLVFLLWFGRKGKPFDGAFVLIYLGGYGLGRFLIEGLRTDQLLIPGTSVAVSQMLGLALFLFSVVMWMVAGGRKKKQAQSSEE